MTRLRMQPRKSTLTALGGRTTGRGSQRLADAGVRREFRLAPAICILPCRLHPSPCQGPLEEGRADDDMSDRLFVSPRSDLDPGTAPAAARRYDAVNHSLTEAGLCAHRRQIKCLKRDDYALRCLACLKSPMTSLSGTC